MAGGSQSEQNPGSHGDSNRKQQDWAIKTNRGRARERQRDEFRQESESPRSDKHTHETAQGCKKHAFGKGLTHQAAPPCAERNTHGHLSLAARSSREQ